MLFNSPLFVFFLVGVLGVYAVGSSAEWRRWVLLGASFAFYANSSDLPTGDPLATSPFYAMDTPNATPTDFYPVFSGWTPTASTKYILVAEFFDHYDSGSVGMNIRCNNAGGYSDGIAGGRTSPIYSSQHAIGTGFATISNYDWDFAVYSASGSAATASTDPLINSYPVTNPAAAALFPSVTRKYN